MIFYLNSFSPDSIRQPSDYKDKLTMLTVFLMIFFMTIAYLLGSLCSAIIVSQLCHLPDPRSSGSKNPGATNIMRLSGTKYAILVLLIDMVKGWLPVFFAHLCGIPASIIAFTALAAILGHIYPVFFDFKGGKGVATTLGVLLGFNWIIGLTALVIWLIVATISRYSSLSSMIAILCALLMTLFMGYSFYTFLPMALITAMVIYQHRENIQRLAAGKESRINFKRK
jgi:glycerol-3-phosphate acyltransferase PlsY